MRTKLVYVLTCAPENSFIEQAVLATFSARHFNPDAWIVLIVDDRTDSLIMQEMRTVLDYISEKIVVPFEADKDMVFRSRWIKTSVRRLVKGEFLFVDCDTITARSLESVDSFSCKIGAVPDSHLRLKDFGPSIMRATKKKVLSVGIDLEKEEYYFSSGVLYVKDCPEAYALYDRWHSIWEEGVREGVNIDQPSLAKANIESGHLIERIPDGYNCVMYTQPSFAKDAFILHFAAYRNPSWLFSQRLLGIVKEEGLPDWLRPCILNPCSTYKPFRYTLSQTDLKGLIRHVSSIARMGRVYHDHVDPLFADMKDSSGWQQKARRLFVKGFFRMAAFYCVVPEWISFKLHPGRKPVANICSV